MKNGLNALSTAVRSILAGGRARYNHRRFFRATFQFMGHLAKAKGRVTEEDIAYARTVMSRLNLTDSERRDAMAFYQQGKSADFDADRQLGDLGHWLVQEPALVTLFLETQLWAAYADQQLNDTDRHLLKALCRHLKIGARQFNAMHRQIRAQRAREDRINPGLSDMTLAEAYALLGVSAGDSDADIKQACRRAMSRNHPDKLIAQGLPESMQKLATEKMHQLQMAHARIRQAREHH